jgi:hypothetical protein
LVFWTKIGQIILCVSMPSILAESWMPFQMHADFEFAETAVRHALSRDCIDTQLKGLHGLWARECYVTFQNSTDMHESLKAACKFMVEVMSSCD